MLGNVITKTSICQTFSKNTLSRSYDFLDRSLFSFLYLFRRVIWNYRLPYLFNIIKGLNMLTIEQFRYGTENFAYLIHGKGQAMAIDGGAWKEYCLSWKQIISHFYSSLIHILIMITHPATNICSKPPARSFSILRFFLIIMKLSLMEKLSWFTGLRDTQMIRLFPYGKFSNKRRHII